MNKQAELARNTLILTIGKICTQFVSFFLLPLYTKLLEPQEYGVVDLFNTYITLLVPLFNWQFENGLFRFMLECRKDKQRQKQLFSTVAISNILQSVVYLCFFFIAQNFITSEYKYFLAIDVVLNIFLNTLLQFPRGLGHSGTYAVGSFLSASTTVLLNVVFIAGFKMGAYGMFWATVIAKAVTVMYLMLSQKVWKYFSISSFSFDSFKQICRYSVPLIPNQLSWWIIGVSDRTIISKFINLAANGIYNVSNKFSSIYITFYNIFNMSWTESVSLHINEKDNKKFLSDTINSMFRFFSSVCFGIIACMPFVFPILINKKYSESYNQIPILMIAVLFQVLVGLYSVIYVALKKSVEIAKTSAYSAVINIVTNIVLIKYIGLYAASFSTLLAYAAMGIYRYFHVKKYVNVPLKKSTIIPTVFIGVLSLVSFYFDHKITNVITLVIVIIYALYINWDFLKSIKGLVMKKLANKSNPKISKEKNTMSDKNQLQDENGVPILYTSEEDCCGCTACCSVCPVKAIKMIENSEGFLYPQIDKEKCVKCHKCINSCAFKNAENIRNRETENV